MVISKPRVVVVGGGWAGCAAAIAAQKAGLEVTLVERSNMLLGTGLVGGIFGNNGRLTAMEELRFMGATETVSIMENASIHNNISFPGHQHASLYDSELIESVLKRVLDSKGITLVMENRATNVFVAGHRIVSIGLANGSILEAESFIDATGTAGPPGHCLRHGNGCVMCIYRCPTFGSRLSLAAKAGADEIVEPTGVGMSGSCEISKGSLARWLADKLEMNGCVIVPIPKYMVHGEMLGRKVCQQYALPEYADNLIILDNGKAKLMTPFFPLENLRQLPGLERAVYIDPYGGGRGNSIRFGVITPRDNSLKVNGLENLFCAGEKAGLMVGHTEAIVTGTLAGYNAARVTLDLTPITLPSSSACGDYINWVGQRIAKGETGNRYTFSGGQYFQRMKDKNLYTTHLGKIEDRIKDLKLKDLFAKPLL